MPVRRFLLALAASLLLHGLAMCSACLDWPSPRTARPAAGPPLRAELRAAEAARSATPLLKNTIEDALEPEQPAAGTPPSRSLGARGRPLRAPAAHVRAAQRRLSEHLFYPPEAIALGLEGEVRLLLRLDATGVVLDARIASSSGFAVLDEAAVRAALATHRLAAGGAAEMILPVVFRLQ